MSGPARWTCLLSILLLRATLAEGAEPAPTPDMELLEFLGMFATDDGEWVDPTGWIGTEPPPGRALDVLDTGLPQPAAPEGGFDD